MTVQTLTLNLPDPLYSRLKHRAEQANRTVEAEAIDALAAAVPAADELANDLAEAISPLALLDDEAVRKAARSRLAAEASARLEELHLKQQREGLTAEETEIRTALVRQYEKAMLVRSEAIALLRDRGNDVSPYLDSQ